MALLQEEVPAVLGDTWQQDECVSMGIALGSVRSGRPGKSGESTSLKDFQDLFQAEERQGLAWMGTG